MHTLLNFVKTTSEKIVLVKYRMEGIYENQRDYEYRLKVGYT